MKLSRSSSFTFPLLAVLASCASETNSPRDMRIATESTVPSADAGPVPLVFFTANYPPYIASKLEPDVEVSYRLLTFDHQRLTFEKARQAIADAAVVETYPAQTPVQGSWEYRDDLVVFKPATPLAVGDYLVRFPSASTDFRAHPKPYNVLRVGPALRLAEIYLLPDKKTSSQALTRCRLRFSEIPDSTSATITIEQLDGATWTPLGWTTSSVSETSGTLPLDPNRMTKITVSSDEIDGQWTGTPGSGPAVVEFRPADFLRDGQIEYSVPPPLTVELPSGKKK
jgi:hypothetical protein